MKTLSSLLLSLFALNATAANHYIRAGATGAATGNDWSNAWTALPATLVRGDTYYVASGVYGSYTMNSVSGTTLILIKKATVADHGTSTGWNDSYASGMAMWVDPTGPTQPAPANSQLASYVTWDGQTGAGLDTNGNYGFCFAFTNQAAANYPGSNTRYGSAFSIQNTANVTFRSCWFQGPVRTLGLCDTPFGLFVDGTFQNLYVTNCFFSDVAVGVQFWAGGSGATIERSYFYRMGSDTTAAHCGAIVMQSCSHLVIRYNIFDTMTGTAGSTSYLDESIGTGTDLQIYGNVAGHLHTTYYSGGQPFIEGTADGFYRCTMGGGGIVTNTLVYNNTLYGLNYQNGGGNNHLISEGYMQGNIFATNNLAQNCAQTIWGAPNVGSSILNSPAVSFVNASGANFHLAAHTSAGTPLPSPYNVDPDGNPRGANGNWDIGAYQYTSVSITNPVIGLTPTSLNFGSIETNTTATLTVTVQNTGDGTLAGAASVSAPFTIVSGGSYNLGANQSQVVTVGYAPVVATNDIGTITFTGGGGATVAVSGSATNPGPIVSSGTLSLTMSSATVTGPFAVSNGILSQPATTTLTNGGMATWTFTVTNAGLYALLAYVNAPSLSANSFYLNIDAMPVDETMAWDILPPTSGWEQRLVSWRGNGTPDSDQYVPVYFNLTAGTHQLYIVGREGGTQLQTISLSRRPDVPQDLHIVGIAP